MDTNQKEKKYRYRVKYVNLNDNKQSFLGELLCAFLLPIFPLNTSRRTEWWEVQCRYHWWQKWQTCISYGGIRINGSDTEEQAIKEMNALKENNVGYWDFHFDYRGPQGNREFFIKEKFNVPAHEMK